jgi:UDP-N-acetylglucosamine--N-acetylmuramyl-(pentapeptide) pyrophosphoryl-undecaprenol N-acetylglucosamine transferase
MKAALTAADLVVARAGSNIFEIAAFGKPSVLIPLSGAANDHQRINAYEFSKAGAAIVIEEANLVPGILLQQIRDTLKKPELLKKMSIAAAGLFKPQAAEIIAEEMFRLAGV